MTFKGFLLIAVLVMLTAKVTVSPDLSWWIVLAPIWIPVAGVLTLMGLGFLKMITVWRR